MSSRDELFLAMRGRLHRATDRLFLWLLLAQWIVAIVLAAVISPWTYTGSERAFHPHLLAAIGLGALINALPISLILLRPGWWGTRHATAVVQLLWSALLITITNGRIETHFHVFGSLASLALYRDWRVLVTGSTIAVLDHVARGLWWPDSVYGAANPEWWRFLEHAAWVVFEDTILIVACVRGTRELRRAAATEARLTRTKAMIERIVDERTLELQEASERYRALVENMEVVTFEYDAVARRVLYIAPQASQLLDCSLDELEDTTLLERAIHPEDRPKLMTQLAALAAGTRAWADPIDCRLVGARGRVVHVRTFLDARAGSRCIRGLALDITRQRQLESELLQAQKLESVGRLAAGVAHEINTPIQFVGDSVAFLAQAMDDVIGVVAKQHVIVGGVLAGVPSTELTAAARDAEATADEVDLAYVLDELPKASARALDGVERVATIVRSMKVFAHPDSDEMVPVDLNQAITSTLTIARNEYRYVANVETELGDLPPVTCYAGEINQVILNVIVNAAHAIGELHARTGTRGKITVRTRTLGDLAEISIHDTGGGIPEHVRGRIFDPFFTTKDVGRGTGQGLAIARSVIVERHGGTLTFETTAGVDTTFFIRIPLRPAAAPATSRAA